ncbi:hypothetical protein DCH27_25310 [Salmonella enterica]|nr:hypothetical protein [Salmonella enterica]
MKKANITLIILAAAATAGCAVSAHPWKDPQVAKGAKHAQRFNDVELCQQLGKAQAMHDKAAYKGLSKELNSRESANAFRLSQADCTGLAVNVIEERKQIAAFVEDSLLGEQVEDGYQALSNYGFTNPAPYKWVNGVNVLILTTANGKISTATLK